MRSPSGPKASAAHGRGSGWSAWRLTPPEQEEGRRHRRTEGSHALAVAKNSERGWVATAWAYRPGGGEVMA
eukprot:scaffold10110_cov51-Isochrysis_galbana.AAC.1